MRNPCKVIFGLLFLVAVAHPSKAENAGYRYNAMVSTRGVAWSLRINDLFTSENTDIPHADRSPNISMQLQQGTNTVSLLFVPIVSQNPETGEYITELYDGLEIEIAIKRNGWREQTQDRLDLLRIRYSEEQGKWLTQDQTYEGSKRNLHTQHLQSNGKFQVSAKRDHEIVYESNLTIDGYRLDIEFTTPDFFPPFHWQNDAVKLEDTPELRQELRAVYRRFHADIERGEVEKIFAKLEPVWARTAYLLADLDSAREYIEGTENGLGSLQKIRPNGYVLEPLRVLDDPKDDQLQFTAEHRLVRFRPEPLLWKKGDMYSKFPVVFYKTRSGEWRVADVATRL